MSWDSKHESMQISLRKSWSTTCAKLSETRMFMNLHLRISLKRRSSSSLSTNASLAKATIQFLSEHSSRPGIGGCSTTKKNLKEWTLCGPSFVKMQLWKHFLANSKISNRTSSKARSTLFSRPQQWVGNQRKRRSLNSKPRLKVLSPLETRKRSQTNLQFKKLSRRRKDKCLSSSRWSCTTRWKTTFI